MIGAIKSLAQRTFGVAARPWPFRCGTLFATAADDEQGALVAVWAVPERPDDPTLFLLDYNRSGDFHAAAAALSMYATQEVDVVETAINGTRRTVTKPAASTHDWGEPPPYMIAPTHLHPLAGAAFAMEPPQLADRVLLHREALVKLAAAQLRAGRVQLTDRAAERMSTVPSPLDDVRANRPESAGQIATLLAIYGHGGLPKEFNR